MSEVCKRIAREARTARFVSESSATVATAAAGGARSGTRTRSRAEAYAVASLVDADYANLYFVARLHDFGGIANETVCDFGNVDEAVLVDADIDERAECRHVRYDSLELHSLHHVVDGHDVFAECGLFEHCARIASGTLEFVDDVFYGEFADVVGDVFGGIDFSGKNRIADKLSDADAAEEF